MFHTGLIWFDPSSISLPWPPCSSTPSADLALGRHSSSPCCRETGRRGTRQMEAKGEHVGNGAVSMTSPKVELSPRASGHTFNIFRPFLLNSTWDTRGPTRTLRMGQWGWGGHTHHFLCKGWAILESLCTDTSFPPAPSKKQPGKVRVLTALLGRTSRALPALGDLPSTPAYRAGAQNSSN